MLIVPVVPPTRLDCFENAADDLTHANDSTASDNAMDGFSFKCILCFASR